jgi:hypothetical protein
MTARPLTVIPPKCTGVQPEKIILMYNSFFLIFKKNIFVITKTVFYFNFNIKKNYVIKKLCYKMLFLIKKN